jgi:hypothetical protein
MDNNFSRMRNLAMAGLAATLLTTPEFRDKSFSMDEKEWRVAKHDFETKDVYEIDFADWSAAVGHLKDIQKLKNEKQIVQELTTHHLEEFLSGLNYYQDTSFAHDVEGGSTGVHPLDLKDPYIENTLKTFSDNALKSKPIIFGKAYRYLEQYPWAFERARTLMEKSNEAFDYENERDIPMVVRSAQEGYSEIINNLIVSKMGSQGETALPPHEKEIISYLPKAKYMKRREDFVKNIGLFERTEGSMDIAAEIVESFFNESNNGGGVELLSKLDKDHALRALDIFYNHKQINKYEQSKETYILYYGGDFLDKEYLIPAFHNAAIKEKERYLSSINRYTEYKNSIPITKEIIATLTDVNQAKSALEDEQLQYFIQNNLKQEFSSLNKIVATKDLSEIVTHPNRFLHFQSEISILEDALKKFSSQHNTSPESLYSLVRLYESLPAFGRTTLKNSLQQMTDRLLHEDMSHAYDIATALHNFLWYYESIHAYLDHPDASFDIATHKVGENARLLSAYTRAWPRDTKYDQMLVRAFKDNPNDGTVYPLAFERLTQLDPLSIKTWVNENPEKFIALCGPAEYKNFYSELPDSEKCNLMRSGIAAESERSTHYAFFENGYNCINLIENTEKYSMYEDLFALDPVELEYLWGDESQKNNLETIFSHVKDPEIAYLGTLIKKRNEERGPYYLIPLMVKSPEKEKEVYEAYHDMRPDRIPLKEYFNSYKEAGKLKRVIGEKIREYSLKIMQEINQNHELPDSIRFDNIESLNAQDLYTLMTFSEQEMFTSTYNGTMNRFLNHLDQNGVKLFKLLEEQKFEGADVFLRLASNYNRLDEIFARLTPEEEKYLFGILINDVEHGKKDVKVLKAMVLADFVQSIHTPRAIELVKPGIVNAYHRAQSASDKVMWGLINTSFATAHQMEASPEMKQVSKKYPLENLNSIKTADLFDRGVCTQEYFFYKDNDGEASFRSFLDSYLGKPGWHVADHHSYVVVEGGTGNKKIQMYANKPEFETEGTDTIQALLEKKKIATLMVVHRGHSYHAQQTIDRIPAIAKIVSLGSCGGYHNIEKVLDKSPYAQIISTKGTGTMKINDPILFDLNNEFLSKEEVDWQSFWDKMEKKVGDDDRFYDYVPPNKNVGLLYLSSYQAITKGNK